MGVGSCAWVDGGTESLCLGRGGVCALGSASGVSVSGSVLASRGGFSRWPPSACRLRRPPPPSPLCGASVGAV